MQGVEFSLILVTQLVLTGLPIVAAMLVAGTRGVRSVPVLLAIGLVASGAVAMLAFWLYYAYPLLGEAFSILVVIGSAGVVGWVAWSGAVDRELLRALAVPLGLWVLGTVFLTYLGFVHGGLEDSLSMSASRFSGTLPNDNTLPRYFAGWIFEHGHAGSVPAGGDWLSSDRPPLQIGYDLSQRPFHWAEGELHYQLLGVALQQTWILGLWALLVAARTGAVTRGLAMVTVLVSDVGIVNGFYVWPKLLPAAMLLAAAALVLTPLWPRVRGSIWGAALVGGLLSLALMGHGASIFGVIPIAVIGALRGMPTWRWLGIAAAAIVVLSVPWTAYQRYEDPPGNRLTKWFLAGDASRDPRGTLETIVDEYGEAGVGGTISNKAENVRAVFGGGPARDDVEDAASDIGEGDVGATVRQIRSTWFLYLVPSFGLLLLAPFAMLALRRRRGERPDEWRLAVACLAAVAIGALGWALLLFGDDNSRTIVHQGTLLLPVLGLCGCVVGLRAVAPRFGLWWGAASAALMLAIYVPAFEPPDGSTYVPLAALAAAAGLAAFVFLAFRAPGSEPSADGVNTLAA